MVTHCHLREVWRNEKKIYFYLHIRQKSTIICLCILWIRLRHTDTVRIFLLFMISATQSRINYRFQCDLQKSFITNDWKSVRHLLRRCCRLSALFFIFSSFWPKNSLQLWRIWIERFSFSIYYRSIRTHTHSHKCYRNVCKMCVSEYWVRKID